MPYFGACIIFLSVSVCRDRFSCQINKKQLNDSIVHLLKLLYDKSTPDNQPFLILFSVSITILGLNKTIKKIYMYR